MSACLIVNIAKYNKSIIKFLREYYWDKFDRIIFACPWHEDKITDGDVMCVHYLYSQWFGNAAEIAESLDRQYDCYVVTDQEGVLSPEFDKISINNIFQRENCRAMLSSVYPLSVPYGYRWKKAKTIFYPFIYSAAEWKELFPPYDDALFKMVNYFGSYDKYISDAFFGKLAEQEETEEMRAFKRILGGLCKVPYPLAYGPADFMVVRGEEAESVFKQMHLWAAVGVDYEAALPTIGVLSYKREEIYTVDNVDCIKQGAEIDKLMKDLTTKRGLTGREGFYFARIPLGEMINRSGV